MMSSTLRATLRSRLTAAMRERDRVGAATLRSALAALDNAEAVPTVDGRGPATSPHVAGAAIGVGAAEAERLLLTDRDERDLVRDEIRGLRDAERLYAEAGEAVRASEAGRGAALLDEVLAGLDGHGPT
jgi:uncharacterized protein